MDRDELRALIRRNCEHPNRKAQHDRLLEQPLARGAFRSYPIVEGANPSYFLEVRRVPVPGAEGRSRNALVDPAEPGADPLELSVATFEDDPH